MKTHTKSTKDITAWTKSLAMECMSGKMDGFIKEISTTISEMALANCTRDPNSSTKAIGKTANRQINKPKTKIDSNSLPRKPLPKRHPRFITERQAVPKN